MKKTSIRILNTNQQQGKAASTAQISVGIRVIPNHYRVKRA